MAEATSETQGPPVVNLKEKFVHFDLKGMPPNPQAFELFFPFLKKIGVTGVMLEYEDMFPFHGRLQSIAHKEAYSASDIATILDAAKRSDLRVIPLVQTFGHMEYVLKLEDFTELKEHHRYLQCICPTNPKSMALIHEMIDQVMSLHPGLEYFHIGCDEVYYKGFCQLCKDRMGNCKMEEEDLFLQHVTHVASYVKSKHKIQPIMWDDEFRTLEEKQIMKYGIGNLVDILVWNYCADVSNRICPYVWEKYAKIFKSIWIGSAFKGANRPNSLMANETHYLSNHYSWMEVVSAYKDQVNFKGIFITGWQRYDHFSILCEVFPVGIPSLVTCMTYLNAVGQQPKMEKVMALAMNFLNTDPELQPLGFPGFEIYRNVLTLSSIQAAMEDIKKQPAFLGWMHDVNIRYQFSSPSHVEAVLSQVVILVRDVKGIHANLVAGLKAMFPKSSVNEWLSTHYNPIATEVFILNKGLEQLLNKETFPARPLPIPDTTRPSIFS